MLPYPRFNECNYTLPHILTQCQMYHCALALIGHFGPYSTSTRLFLFCFLFFFGGVGGLQTSYVVFGALLYLVLTVYGFSGYF